MDTTPKSKGFSRRLNLDRGKEEVISAHAPNNAESTASTPVNRKSINLNLDDSPVFFANSQDISEEVDVHWHWPSPQNTQIGRRKQLKRTIPNQSPIPPIKRHPTNTQNFDKVQEELRILQAQFAIPDDERSLCVSPQQESELKGITGNNYDNFDDIFNDSIDEQLLVCSQQIEEQLLNDEKNKNCDKSPVKGQTGNSLDLDDDSLDELFATIPLESIEVPKPEDITPNIRVEIEKNRLAALARLSNKQNRSESTKWTRTISEDSLSTTIETASGKVEFFRTRSFELDAIKQQPKNLSKSIQEEIERKRLEALSRLESKRKDKTVLSNISCSPEEIEKKRLQALAKLEAKRKQSIIEKKRQEALKRLEMNRLKNAAGNVKSALSKRL